MLAHEYSRGEGDYLHLNMHGVSVLASKIKTHIFDRKKERSGKITPGRSFANVARRPSLSSSQL